MALFSKTAEWLRKWTWKRVWKLVAPILLELIKDQLEDLVKVAKKDGEEAVKELKELVDEKIK
jgi:DNA-binding FrmR family transcriptional regulator